MLLDKYRPKNIEEMINKESAKEVKKLILQRNKFIISGPIGSGKTLSIELIGKELNYEIINISDDILSNTKEVGRQSSIFYKGKIFVADIESIRSMEKLEDLIKNSLFSVVIISCDIYQKKYYEIRKKYRIIKFRKASSINLASIVKKICIKEEIKYDENSVSKLISMYNNDIRSTIIALECLKSEGLIPTSLKDLEECKSLDVFEILEKVFNSDIRENARMLSVLNQDLVPWIEENIVEGRSLEGHEYFALADLFRTRAEKGAWSLEKYNYDFLGGISTIKCGKKMFNPPFSKRRAKT